ncbi:MAG: radical SAM protein [Promethearchaeota archaeon]|nr:MAG: radical SAM protein [Candidatus Lokiarchaeota archaeon]
MKTLLIYPPFRINAGMGKVMCSPPLSLMNLAGASPDSDIEILDLNVDHSYGIDKMEKKIRKFDLVGMSCMTNMYRIVLNICKIAKRNDVPTLIGGFHPTLDKHIIEDYDCIDMIVRGEGEETFKELMDGKPKEEILGLSYKNNGRIHNNPDRPFIRDLDDLPYPKKDLIDYDPYHYLWVPADVVETSRGCPFDCNFCCVTQFYQRKYRMKSPYRVIRDLYQVPESQNLVFFVDDNFTLDSKRIIKICKLIQQSHLNSRLRFVCQSRVDDVANHPEMVKEMKKAGFICFFMGFESFRQNSLNTMNKQYKLNKVKKAIRICHQNDIMIFGSFIIGNIGETKEDVRFNIEMMSKLKLDFMMTNPLTAFPGTPLYYEALENGWVDKEFRFEDWDFGPMVKTPDLSKDDIQELLDESYESFYTNPRWLVLDKIKGIKSLFSKNAGWVSKQMMSFFSNGISKFMMNL